MIEVDSEVSIPLRDTDKRNISSTDKARRRAEQHISASRDRLRLDQQLEYKTDSSGWATEKIFGHSAKSTRTGRPSIVSDVRSSAKDERMVDSKCSTTREKAETRPRSVAESMRLRTLKDTESGGELQSCKK
jgi:hypothetical protein